MTVSDGCCINLSICNFLDKTALKGVYGKTVIECHTLENKLFISQFDAHDKSAVTALDALKAALLQCVVEFGGATGEVTVSETICTVLAVKLTGLLAQLRAKLVALLKEMGQPVIIAAIAVDGFLHHAGAVKAVILLDGFSRPFNNPLQDVRPRILLKISRIILDVPAALDGGVKGNDDAPPPNAVICRADSRQMISIKH